MLGNWPGQMVYLKGEERRLNNCVWMVVNFCVFFLVCARVDEEISSEVPVSGDIFGSGLWVLGNGFPLKMTLVDVGLLFHIC